MIILLKFTNDKSNIKLIYCHFYAYLGRKGEEKSCFFTIKIIKWMKKDKNSQFENIK